MESSQSSTSVTVAHVDESNPGRVDCPSLLRNVPYEVLSYIFVLCSCNHSVELPYDKTNIPCQVILSQVCSQWCQVALSTGALWNNVVISDRGIDGDYAHSLSLYKTWIDRADAHSLTVTLELSVCSLNVQTVFQDFVIPFQIKMLNITLKYEDFHKLSKFATLNVEEFAISLTKVRRRKHFATPRFINKARRICLRGAVFDDPGHFQATLKELCLPCRQLRSLQCRLASAFLSSLLDILRQVPSLEQCHLTIYGIECGHAIGISMPNLRWLTLKLKRSVDPDIVIPLLAAPNLTKLVIYSYHNWSVNTYDILRRHHKLHQLQQIELGGLLPIRVAQVLVDAPMIHELRIDGQPVVDAEALEGIASGRLGRHLSSLYLGDDCFDHALVGKCLDMIEARQRHVNAMVTQVSNWQQMLTGIRLVEFQGVYNRMACEERVVALKALGTTVTQRMAWRR